MRTRNGLLFAAGWLLSNGMMAAPSGNTTDLGNGTIRGDYLEARTADVYTGPCIANGEVNLNGDEAVLAWKVREGSWQGVDLEGLTVIAAVKANATLGDPYANPYPARSVLVVDEKATPAQKDALVDFARTMGGDLLHDVLAVRTAPVTADFGKQRGFAALAAGDLIELRTRALTHHDHFCGNESVYYPPLTPVADPTPAYTLAHAYRGGEFDTTWSSPLKRSAFVAEFVR